MRIVIDARLYGLHHRGIGRYLMELVRGIVEYGGQDRYTLLIEPKTKDQLPALPRNINTVEAPWGVYSLAEQFYLPRLIKRLKPDLVHWPHFNAPYFCPVPFVITIHDLILHHAPTERATTLPGPLYWSKVILYRILIQRLVKKARRIITVSRAVERDLLSHYPKLGSKIKVIPLAVSRLPEAAAFESSKPYLLMVGAAYPHKNIERAIEAAVEARQTHPELELRLVGRRDIFTDRLKQALKRQKLTDWVIFMDQVSDLELSSLYRGCQAYMLLSLEEGFGLGSLEAVSGGAPVIASDIPVLREVLEQGALYAQPTDTAAIADAIIRTFDQNTRKRIIEAGREVLRKYDWSETVKKTLEIYKC